MKKGPDGIMRVVARELAMGFNLGEICEARRLDLEDWRKISKSAIFAAEVKRIQDTIESEIIEQAVSDPVILRLKMEAEKSVKRLANERDNFDREEGGATAATRIAAANSILDRLGYGGKREEKAASVNITISAEKVEAIKKVEEVKGNTPVGDFKIS